MYAVLLAAGARLYSDNEKQYPTVSMDFKGESKIAYIISHLPQQITDVIVVHGQSKKKLISLLGSEHKGRSITYIEQTVMNGSDGALRLCESLLHNQEKFLVLNGDDLYHESDLERMLRYPYALLVEYSYEAQQFGIVSIDEEDNFESIHERSSTHSEGLVNAGAYVLGNAYFSSNPVLGIGDQFSLPHTLLSIRHDNPARVVHATSWFPLRTLEHKKRAEQEL